MNFTKIVFVPLFCAFLSIGKGIAATHSSFLQTITLPDAVLTINARGKTDIRIPGYDVDESAQKPVLPVVPYTLDLPEGAVVDQIEVTEKDIYTYSLLAPILWGQPATHPGSPLPALVEPDPKIAQEDSFYPAEILRSQRSDRMGDRTRLSITLSPIRINPIRKEILGARKITLEIKVKPEVIRPRIAAAEASSLPPGHYTYLIVAPDFLLKSEDPWNFQRLCAVREKAGHKTHMVSTEWINSHYEGEDLPTRLRLFLRDAHRRWGIRYLLLGGNFTLIPVKKLSVTVRSFTTHKTQIPSDGIFYGCLDGPMDGNGNQIYGELTDGIDGKDIDLLAELLVGRFPVENIEELSHMVRKTLTYEAATPAELRPVSFMGEQINIGNQTYASPHMEEIRLGSKSYCLETLGFVNGQYAQLLDTDTFYDSDTFKWSQADALNHIDRNWQVINHLGHGATRFCMKINLYDAQSTARLQALTNSIPWMIYSQACLCGGFDNPDCFAEQIVTATNGAVATIMNAREGWLFIGSVGGQSHRFNRCFWDALFSGRGSTLGELNDLSRQDNLALLGSYENFWRWVYMEVNLFGDPAMTLMPKINQIPAVVHHEPLPNTYRDDRPYTINCNVTPIGLYDPEKIYLLWHNSADPGLIHTQKMSNADGNLFTADIPPHPRGNQISYRISAETLANQVSLYPSATNSCSFSVTDRLELKIFGSPDNIGVPDPDYGTIYFASGRWANVTAPERTYISQDERFDFYGHVGIGSALSSPDARSASFIMYDDSILVWLGHRAYRAQLCATQDLFTAQEFWTDEETEFTIPSVPATITKGETLYRFSEWLVDGKRYPQAPKKCLPDEFTLVAETPHLVEVLYLPETLDEDGNGIRDWWERMFYGRIGNDPNSDDDGDGFTLAEEFPHWSDPTSSDEFPSPPEIHFDPLPSTVDYPAPYTLTAAIKETREVVDPTLHWQIANSDHPQWKSVPFIPLEGKNQYRVTFAEEAKQGNLIRYFVTATDPTGWDSASRTNDFFIAYPIVGTSLLIDTTTQVTSTQEYASVQSYLFNLGNAPLNGELRFTREDPITDATRLEWGWESVEQPWEISTNRTATPPYSLHCQLDHKKGATSTSPVHGSITFPPSLVGQNAALSFDYWIHGEPDKKEPLRTFDGGIVEYSLDNGETFRQLEGPYTHTIYGWESSPWPDGTPCFSGNGEEGWRKAVFDLKTLYPEYNGFAGQTVIFRFQMGGDNNQDNEGWYLDNVRLSPLGMHAAYSVSPLGSFSVGGGGYLPVLSELFPLCMKSRNETVKVEFLTNDPVQPITGFFWTLRIRDLPVVTLNAIQTVDGTGNLILDTTWQDIDGATLSAMLEGSVDDGQSWFPLSLTDVQSTIQTNLPSAIDDGHFPPIITATNGVPAPHPIGAIWNTAEYIPDPLVYTQICIRATAGNPWFTSTQMFGSFVLDKEPPRFTGLPHWSSSGYIRHSENCFFAEVPPIPSCQVFFPDAEDFSGTVSNLLTFTFAGAEGIETLQTNLFSGVNRYVITNRIDCAVTLRMIAQDPFGNLSEPIESTAFYLSANGDFDNDGMSTEDEYGAGTSPYDPNSCLRVCIRIADGELQLTWPSVIGKTYRIESTPALVPPLWKEISPDIAGTGFPITHTLQSDQPTGFYRIKVMPTNE